ncbi:unnamed protein product [Tetraodon nigroviridis]|uniref:(spotted green pufferfish) hypothetical protein n=1 Tax=Tetraodon nigroviridis TaxID=99883 RepID=Q4SQQ5_TETNG|nr:unnamed protein product [Tetraodon nigroviridis]
MSLRQPTSTLDRLSSLTVGDSERRSSGAQQRDPSAELPAEGAGPGLIHRCVVVQKDHLGFGFTVCGERVKLVQNVRAGGAAVKAGVQEGDRIIKVNGALVSTMSHQEVVKLIKSGPFVALTLQGPPPSTAALPLEPLPTDLTANQRASLSGEAPPSPPPPVPPGMGSIPSQRITGPKPLQDPEVQKHASEILRKMLEQEEAELQNLLEERKKNPSPSLDERIERARRRAHQVAIKIQQDQESSRSEPVPGYVIAGRLSVDSSEGDVEVSVGVTDRYVSDTHPLTPPPPPPSRSSSSFPRLARVPTPPPRPSGPHSTDARTRTRPRQIRAQIIGPEEEYDDDYSYTFADVSGDLLSPAHLGFPSIRTHSRFPSPLPKTDGPFQDIELLKLRPAHMTVFMRYIFTQLLDPNPLVAVLLSVEAYLGSSSKEARALAPQICSHFLDPDAPLKIKAKEEFLSDIGATADGFSSFLDECQYYFQRCDYASVLPSDSRLHAQEDIRGPLSELQQLVLPEIQDQIQDYRNKQMMGLGNLFGQEDLQPLDGDPAKERQVVDKQVIALWEILSKHEEDRSSPLAWAVLLYLRHSGIKLRDSKVFPGLTTEKEKWLAFLKTKKLSGIKKEKDGEDKKRNPILKYIAKPRTTSQSTFHVPLSPSEVRSGNVRNIIQQFENHTEAGEEGGDAADAQRLSSSSLGEDSMDSPTVSVRLARSESLKAQGEGRRRGAASGTESVPRSRSDVDMEDCGDEREGPVLRPLQHSASSSASSSSARSLENPTPPYTPRSRRRSVDSPLALLPDSSALEEEVCEGQNWQDTVSPQLLAALTQREVDRQAVIYGTFGESGGKAEPFEPETFLCSSPPELFTTEVSHLRTLKVLDQVFFQKMRPVLNAEELACIFPNLPQVYELHGSFCEAMKKRRESPVVQDIGDIMLARFEGQAGEEFQEQASQLCSQHSQAVELIKNKKRKDPRFSQIIQECEASPLCRRLQLKDLLVSEMHRITKYPLLLDKIMKHTEAGAPDLPSLQRAQACCRGILQTINEVVRETEHRQQLGQYQRRLDAAPQFKDRPSFASVLQNLDLTTKRMIHEGPLTWKVSKDKQIEIQALLLSDCLVLLQRGPDDRLLLRHPSRWLGGGGPGGGDSKTSFSPLVKLDSLLVRSVATGNVAEGYSSLFFKFCNKWRSNLRIWIPDHKALYVISTTERQIYELVAGTSSEKNTWKDLLEKTISAASGSSPQTNHTSMPIASSSVSPVSAGSHGYAEPSETKTASLSDAALQDVETLRRLILRDLEEDIEVAHHKLLKTLSSSANQESEDQQRSPTTVSRTPSLDRGSINSERETEILLPQARTRSVTSPFAFTQAERPAQQNPRSSPPDSDAAAAATSLVQARLMAQRCSQTQPLLPSEGRGGFIIYLLLPVPDSAVSERWRRLCARGGDVGTEARKVRRSGKAALG